MKRHLNKKGLTLLEVIISIAIIGIIVVSFLSLFSNSFVQVIRSGNKGTSMYSAQTTAEDQLENTSYSESGSTTITVSWGSSNLSMDGNLKTLEVDVPNDPENDKAMLKIFITEEDE
jgi:prepilin-type N-terminal cleavage/methylation domain-containing protein